MKTKLVLCMVLALLSTTVFAQSAEVGTISKVLQALVDILTGATARYVAIIAVAGLGWYALKGNIPLTKAVMMGIGIGIIFGSAAIVDMAGVA